MAFDRLVLLCRSGYEKECVQEIQWRAEEALLSGYGKTKPNTGLVEYQMFNEQDLMAFYRQLDVKNLIFARQLFIATAAEKLPVEDRVTPLVEILKQAPQGQRLWVETADTNEAKELSRFCRKISVPLKAALQREQGYSASDEVSINHHALFLNNRNALVGYSQAAKASDWVGGIPRLRFPKSAPSRSTLKLEEAFLHFLNPREREEWLRLGRTAVDLGAAPGGWTWQLVSKGLQVYAVDNGPMDKAIMDSGQVEHLRENAFTYQPPHRVDWLVCDMVEKPARVSELIIEWFVNGWTRRAMFNLKLPMKQRWHQVELCREGISQALSDANLPHTLQIKHLYHDRDEVTCYLAIRKQ